MTGQLILAPAGRGALIVFEGLDRCGKTTQIQKLVERLLQAKVPAQSIRFPDRSLPSGKKIDDYLSKRINLEDEEVHQLFAENRKERKQQMLTQLLSGTTLVVDRYAFSGVAYSAAKGNPRMDVAWCKACDEGLPAPDKVLFFKLSPEAAAKRGDYGNERYELPEFQAKVGKVFEQLHDDRWATINADATIEEVHEQVWAEVQPVLESVRQGAPILKLWDHAPIALEPGLGDATVAISLGAPATKIQQQQGSALESEVDPAGQHPQAAQ